MDNNSHISSEKNPLEETVGTLSKGLVDLYTPNLEKIQKELYGLCEKQSVVVEQLHNENLKISSVQHSPDLQDIFNTVNLYNHKLMLIKKDMKVLHERSTKLKKRAIKLQQYKEKECSFKIQQKEEELKREQNLIGKSGSGSDMI